MKRLIYLFEFTAFLTIVFCSSVNAQISFPEIFESDNDWFPKKEYLQDSDFGIQSGAFIGTNRGGLEITHHPQNSTLFGSIYYGTMFNPDQQIPDARQMRFGGFTIGYERSLKVSGNASDIHVDSGVIQSDMHGMQAYFRIGSGMSFHTVHRLNLSTGKETSRLYPGVQALGLAGVSTRISKSASIFLELGGRVSWNRGLPVREWQGWPFLSIGVYTVRPW